jgi:hypothetical protein
LGKAAIAAASLSEGLQYCMVPAKTRTNKIIPEMVLNCLFNALVL